MTGIRIAIETGKAAAPVKRVVGRGLDAFNIAATGEPADSEFCVSARDAKGKLLGGYWVLVYWETAFLKWAWLSEKSRGGGIGRRLMAEAEREAKARGAKLIYLDTFSFQARPFYEKLGYEVFGTLAYGRPGIERFWMKKAL
jgi:GNAT superfamily N-acetyltransferase